MFSFFRSSARIAIMEARAGIFGERFFSSVGFVAGFARFLRGFCRVVAVISCV